MKFVHSIFSQFIFHEVACFFFFSSLICILDAPSFKLLIYTYTYACIPPPYTYIHSIIQTVFEHIADALGILITLDKIFAEGRTLREHWNQYKRYRPSYSCYILHLLLNTKV